MIEGIPVGEFSAPALLAFVIILILTGRLVPRWYVKQLEARNEALEKANAALLAQNNELLETSRLGRATWLALERGARE